MYDGHGFGLGGGLMWLFWIIVIALIVWVVRIALDGQGSDRKKESSPLEILQERLARGEIDEQEFERKRRLLNR